MSKEKDASKEIAEPKAVSESSALHNEAFSEMKMNAVQNKASTNSSERAQFLDCPPVPGYGHTQDDIFQHNTRTPNGLNHNPMEMTINSGHSVDNEMTVFANPSLRENWLAHDELRAIPHPQESRHHSHRHAIAPAEGGGRPLPQDQVVIPNVLSPGSLRLPDLPRLNPIASAPLDIDHERNAERARQAAQSAPFRHVRH